MSKQINRAPSLPFPTGLNSFPAISNYLGSLMRSVNDELRDHALRLVNTLVSDGTETPQAPVIFKPYVKAALPDVALYVNGMIIVTDDVGGLTPAFSDGVNWRRTSDRAVIA